MLTRAALWEDITVRHLVSLAHQQREQAVHDAQHETGGTADVAKGSHETIPDLSQGKHVDAHDSDGKIGSHDETNEQDDCDMHELMKAMGLPV